jgi:hypothetical protein
MGYGDGRGSGFLVFAYSDTAFYGPLAYIRHPKIVL